ncbi:S41 family peptidase [Erythrobacter alti]|uniref:S41 family peptidase n=1 Tax=Erythrobacter alti TaxID=1896145 RepID=UPI0030F40146
MQTSKFALSIACAAMLASCGGGSTPTPTPIATGGGGGAGGGGGGGTACSLAARQDFTLGVFNEWYLFPSLLDTSVNQSNFNNLQDYIDALVAPARAQSKDRFFSYVTSIEEENAFFNSGASAGFGIRLAYDTPNRRVFVIDAFEGAPALGANIDRGTEIIGIGTTANNIETVNSLMANGGPAAVSNALGPSTVGTTRVLRIIDSSGVQREVSISKAEFDLDPVSDRFGAQIINDGGKQVGYLNLRTFISTADPDLRAAFADFRAAGVTELIVDFRYNGGGAISIAELMGDLMGRNFVGEVFEQITWRPSKSDRNEIARFTSRPQSIAPTRIAFIGTGSTASASELVINGMQPWVPNIALVGSNTFGKPVGQSAFDLAECDDRLRVVTIQIENANGQGEYFNGLATTVPNTCRANDDIRFQMGDPREAMTAVALDYLAGRACTAIAGGPSTTASALEEGVLVPELPERTAAQHEVPGLY